MTDSADPKILVKHFTVASELPVFAGHFPGNPIVPGVTQLQWAIAFLQEQLSLKPSQSPPRCSRVKFLQIMKPDAKVCLQITALKPGRWGFRFTEDNATDTPNQTDTVFSSGIIVLNA